MSQENVEFVRKLYPGSVDSSFPVRDGIVFSEQRERL
jgi:hypothetical protein